MNKHYRQLVYVSPYIMVCVLFPLIVAYGQIMYHRQTDHQPKQVERGLSELNSYELMLLEFISDRIYNPKKLVMEGFSAPINTTTGVFIIASMRPDKDSAIIIKGFHIVDGQVVMVVDL